MTDKPQFGSSRVWVTGLVLGLGLFVVTLASPTPDGLHRGAAKKLMERLPAATAAHLTAQVGAPLSPEFDEQFARFEAMAAETSVAVHKKDGHMITVAALAALSPARQKAYRTSTVAALLDRAAGAAHCVLAVALLMVVFWVLEVLPIPVTALLPLVLFPVLGVAGLGRPTFPAYFSIGAQYGHHLIFLFMGTFMLSAAMIRWGLDRRVALHILKLFGSRPAVLMLGFMITAAALSMWISNTATAAMMVPIALAVVDRVKGEGARTYRTGVLLSVAYSASIGGIATLIGSPPNAVYAGFAQSLAGHPVSFAEWFSFGLPFVLVFLPVMWLVQARRYVPAGLSLPSGGALEAPGPLGRGEVTTAAIFVLMALLWLSRGAITIIGWPGWTSFDPFGFSLAWAKDSTVALLGAVLLFAVPVNFKDRTFALDLRAGMDISWGTLLLFGGGLALGQAIGGTGVAIWLADLLQVLAKAGPSLLLLAVALFASFVTEITSNTATATMLMPVMYALGRSLGGKELMFMSTAAVSTSLAFMLPIATPPNAVIYGTGVVQMKEMIKAGFILDIMAVLTWWLLVMAMFGV